MYIRETELFRQQYCRLWRAMFLLDKKTLTDVCSEWGIDDPEFFASVQLMTPYSADYAPHLHRQMTSEELQQFQRESKVRFRALLKQTEKLPKELIFLGRCMNLIRAANRDLGNPVQRIDIFASCAASGGGWPLSSWIWFKMQLCFDFFFFF